MRALSLCPALCFATWAAGAHAQAGSLPLELDWDAPQGCASESEIRAELDRIARARPGRAIPRLSARGRIEKVGDVYRLQLHTERDGKAGERTLEAEACRPLEREATLVLAVAFGEGIELVDEQARTPDAVPAQPARAARSNGPQPARTEDAEDAAADATPGPLDDARKDAGEPPRPLAPAAPDRLEPGRSSGEASSFRWAAFAGAGAVLRIHPKLAGAVIAGAELGVEQYWLEPRVSFVPGVDQDLERGVVGSFSSLQAGLAACAGWPTAGVRAGACLGFDVTALAAESTGAGEDGSATAALFAADGTLLVSVPASSQLSVRLHAQALFALHEPSFVVEGLGEVHRVPRIAAAFGAALRFAP